MAKATYVLVGNKMICKSKDDVLTKEYLAAGKAQQEAKQRIHLIKDYEPARSPIDGTILGGRADHREHMKKHNVFCVGNDTQFGRKREIRGDFNVRAELKSAVQQVMEQQNAR